MSKSLVEDTRSIDINWLMREEKYKEGYLYNGRSLTWTTTGAFYESKNSISFSIDLLDTTNGKMNLDYVVTDVNTQDKIKKAYSVRFTKTLCNFGGSRYWFLCPNVNCSRRVGKLYFGQKLFLCRHCLDLSYESRNEIKKFRQLSHMFDYESKQEKLSKKIWGKYGRRLYGGKPTKTYQKYMRYDYLTKASAKKWLELDHLLKM